MVRLILHIGDGKCGSSAIQSALWHRQEELDAAGLLYRAPRKAGGHFGFVSLLGWGTRRDGEKSLQEAGETIAAMRQRLAQGNISHVILSAESFLTASPERILDIARRIHGDFSGVDVIAYVREPAGMYLSWVQQELKGSHLFKRPEDYDHRLDDYLIPWTRTPLVDSVTVRVFDRAALIGGSVVPDFAAILSNLSGQEVVLEDVEKNTSLTAEQMVVLQDFRARFQKDSRNKRTPDTDRLIAMFRAINAEAQIGTRPRLQARWRDMIRSRAAPVFRRLEQAFPGLGELVAGAPALPDGAGAPSNPRDVQSILEPVDEGVTGLYRHLIPEFEPALRDGLTDAAAQALRALEAQHGLALRKSATILSRYWARAGAERAAAALRAQLEKA